MASFALRAGQYGASAAGLALPGTTARNGRARGVPFWVAPARVLVVVVLVAFAASLSSPPALTSDPIPIPPDANPTTGACAPAAAVRPQRRTMVIR